VSEVEAGFEYRDITGQDTSERTGKWQQTKLTRATTTGAFSADVTGLKTGNACEFRAVAMSGTQTVYGREMELKVQ
jgi:hypothetical protein